MITQAHAFIDPNLRVCFNATFSAFDWFPPIFSTQHQGSHAEALAHAARWVELLNENHLLPISEVVAWEQVGRRAWALRYNGGTLWGLNGLEADVESVRAVVLDNISQLYARWTAWRTPQLASAEYMVSDLSRLLLVFTGPTTVLKPLIFVNAEDAYYRTLNNEDQTSNVVPDTNNTRWLLDLEADGETTQALTNSLTFEASTEMYALDDVENLITGQTNFPVSP